MSEHLPALIEDSWLCRLVEGWLLPFVVEPSWWGPRLVVMLWRPA